MAKQLFLQINNFTDVELESYRVVSTPRKREVLYKRGGSLPPEIQPGGYDQSFYEIEIEFRIRPDLFAFLFSSAGLNKFRVTIKEMEVLTWPPYIYLLRVNSFFCTQQKALLPKICADDRPLHQARLGPEVSRRQGRAAKS